MSEPSLDSLDIHTKELYVSRGYPWREWDLLRREAPVFWYEREGMEPFWAVTRHEDILTISKHAEVFVNSRRLRLQTMEEDARQFGSYLKRAEARGWDPKEPPDFIFMDDPRHRKFRLLAAKRFTPASLKKLETHFDDLSRNFAEEFSSELARSGARGESCDFVRGFAQKLPLSAIGEMMGLPPNDWMRLKTLTNVMIGAPEVDFFHSGESRNRGVQRAVEEMTDYMLQLIDEHQARGAPTPRGGLG